MPDGRGPRMTGRTALVTGASSGIGRATALRLAEEGARVALLALPGSLHDVTAECRSRGSDVIAIEADVTDAVAVDRAFAEAESLGEVDAVFSAAGISSVAALCDTSDELWARQLQVNLTGTFHVVRAAARLMVPRRRGAIVMTGSELAITGQAGYVAYSASKGGILAITRTLAAELAPFGIRVNVVCPGVVNTPLLAAEFALASDPSLERRLTEQSVALGRIGRPEEIASTVAFLLSEDSAYTTGAQFVVDGGRTGCFPITADMSAPLEPQANHLSAGAPSKTGMR
jgi:NAD(P)-dependent dehydrogenase (short-subunit alcohol dehydrogenase family)